MPVRVLSVGSDDEYWIQVERLKGSTEFFNDQGDAHGHIDGDLQDAIEGLLVPRVGPWERSEKCYHIQDFFGNGLRILAFRAGDFPWDCVLPLQKLLVGDAARFCISIQIVDTLDAGNAVGALAILQECVVATPYALEMLEKHVGVAP